MLYQEFIEGTGCRENDHNYQVYKELEIIYMSTDCSKQHIYDMGKKLVDNSKTEKELEIEAEIKAEIERYKDEIEGNKRWIDYYEEMGKLFTEDGDKAMAQSSKRMVKYYKKENAGLRSRIRFLKLA